MANIEQFLLTKGWVIQVFIIILVTAVLHAISALIAKRLRPKISKTKNHWDDALLDATQKPLVIIIWLLGITFAIDVMRVYSSHEIVLLNITTVIREIGLTACIIWILIRFIHSFEASVITKNEHKENFDKTGINAISQILRVSVFITGILICLSILGIPLSSVIAFGGFGGIAAGFAAKDSLANFFGGMMIYFDKPFKVGDWVRSPDRNIEGTVEYIGWRLTRIRTFDKRPLYVPNGVFSTISLENPSRMTNRRIRTIIGLRYDDATKVAEVLSAIEAMLRNHPEIDTRQTLMVNLVNFGASALEFMVYTFTKTTNWVKFQAIQQDVFLKIIDIIYQHGAECAFPTSTLHIPDGVNIFQPTMINEEG